jgi:hypothetical protein
MQHTDEWGRLRMFDNALGMYVDVPWLRDGVWYEDSAGALYIVPGAGVIADCEGPDNAMMDAIISAEEGEGELRAETLKHLGLIVIPDVLKRFDPEYGYYHA